MKTRIQYNIGKAKYVVSYYNGIKKHPDGSEFWDMEIFSSKKKMDKFLLSLQEGQSL